jgi:hypothetical protein
MLTVADMGMVDWSMKAMNKAMGDREKPEGPHEPGLVGELHAPTSWQLTNQLRTKHEADYIRAVDGHPGDGDLVSRMPGAS